ncbi:MAG: hypothetical protein GY798_34705 [Hyphomicrobiales bacterium]|nr:hypothetical protein [Hyphomicrobiales bacterium]
MATTFVSASVAGLVGGPALVVNAVDDEAARLWQRRDLVPLRDDPLVLFHPSTAIAASLAEARR